MKLSIIIFISCIITNSYCKGYSYVVDINTFTQDMDPYNLPPTHTNTKITLDQQNISFTINGKTKKLVYEE